jgi:putative ABC transport system ATP-binding protein
VILSVESVFKSFKQSDETIAVLKGVQLSVEPGQVVSIVGPSGGGKSTLLSLLAGIDRPTSGAVRIAGKDLASLDESEMATLRSSKVGFIFQSFHLIQHLSAIENVELAAAVKSVGQDKDAQLMTLGHHERALQLLEQVGLSHRLHHRPSQLSGGEAQRVAIARSLINDPDILLADEPSGNLDYKTGQHLMELLFTLARKEKKALVLVTHDRELANLADVKYQLLDGKLVSIQ